MSEVILKISKSSHPPSKTVGMFITHDVWVFVKPFVRLAYFVLNAQPSLALKMKIKRWWKINLSFPFCVLPPEFDVYIYLYSCSLCSISPLSVFSHCLDWSIFNFLLETMRGGGLWLLVELSLPLNYIICSLSVLSFPPSLSSSLHSHWLQRQNLATVPLLAIVCLALALCSASLM